MGFSLEGSSFLGPRAEEAVLPAAFALCYCGFLHPGISICKAAIIIMNNPEFLICPLIPETENINGPLG